MAPSKRPRPQKESLYGKDGVFFRFPEGAGGRMEIKIDYTHVPPPVGYFYADAISLKVDTGLSMATLSFQRTADQGEEGGERVDVVMPADAL
jgi:hypothetical protein